MITQDELKESLTYHPDTGLFTYNSGVKGKKVGSTAGYINNRGYVIIKVKGESHLAHRLAFLYMNGKLPSSQIDHRNHVKNDNRWCNLKEVSEKENKQNQPIRINNKSGVTGVSMNQGSWVATITIDYKQIHLGRSKSLFEAICLRKSAENKYKFYRGN